MSLDVQQTQGQSQQHPLTGFGLPPRPTSTPFRHLTRSKFRKRYKSIKSRQPRNMDTYSGYREPPVPRSPVERSNWGSRDEGRPAERATDRTDTFYRGRSPGMSIALAPFLNLFRGATGQLFSKMSLRSSIMRSFVLQFPDPISRGASSFTLTLQKTPLEAIH